MNQSLIKKLQIQKIISETTDAKTFVLQALDGWVPDYKSGQFLTLVFHTKYGEKRRSYSISSSPVLNEQLSITIKKVDNGEFSRLLLYHAKEGDILFTSGTNGHFLLPENVDFKHCVFLAAGSGITPCFSLIKTLLVSSEKLVTLIYSNKSKEDTIFYKALTDLQKQYPERFSIRFLFSNLRDVYNSRLSDWLLQQLIKEYVPDISRTLFYTCGPHDYMLMARISLLNNYVSAKNIFKENFSTLPPPLKNLPPDINPHNVTISISNQQYELIVQYPQSVLATAKANNIELPYSCEAGRCGSCAATCVSGKIWMAYNEVLTDEEIQKGRVLTCQGYPIGGNVELIFE